jgi:hypothetical protein
VLSEAYNMYGELLSNTVALYRIKGWFYTYWVRK